MAFCKYCGASIPDGQTCTCAQAQAAAQQAAAQQSAAQQPAAQAAAAAQSTVVEAAKSVKPYLTEYFVNPANAVRRVVEQDNMTMAIALTVIRFLALGLAVFGLLRNICSTATSAAATAMGAMGAITDAAGMSVATTIKAPFLGSILWGGIIALIGMALFAVMVFALVRIQKGTTSFKAIFEASSANGILTSALLLVAFVLSFLSLSLCLAFIGLSLFSWMICGVLTAQLLCPDNASGKFWLLYFVGVVLVVIIGYYVIPGLFLKAVGGISVTAMGVTTTLQSAIDGLKSQLAQLGGLSGIINGMMSEFF